MTNLKKLGAAVVLTVVLSLSAFAGDMNSPPCTPPEPGQIPTMPCAAAQPAPDDPTAPGETHAPPASYTLDILSVVDAAMNLLLLF